MPPYNQDSQCTYLYAHWNGYKFSILIIDTFAGRQTIIILSITELIQ